MEAKDLLNKIPVWLLIFVLVAFLLIFIERIYVSEKTFMIYGKEFGPASINVNQGLPIGSIIAWDPRVRDKNGNVTRELRELTALPKGWSLCNGHNGTPFLDRHILGGVKNSSSAGWDKGLALNKSDESYVQYMPLNKSKNLAVYQTMFLCKTK